MLQEILKKLEKSKSKLVAVSKTKPVSQILDMYQQGQRAFGENRVQELLEKQPQLPTDIEWHAIGHLQTNKVKYIAPFVSMIHAVDSLKLLQEINKQAKKNERRIDCLLQIKIAAEDTKFGLDQATAISMLISDTYLQMRHIRIVGLMGMATFTNDQEQVRDEFRTLKTFFDQLKTEYFQEKDYFQEISMGMSGDFEIAQEEGSTIVRIGSLLFGSR